MNARAPGLRKRTVISEHTVLTGIVKVAKSVPS